MRPTLFAILIAALVLPACGGNSPATPTAPNPTPSPTPVADFVFRGVAFEPPAGTKLDLGYPTADWDKQLEVGGAFTPMKPATMLPAAIGIVFVCDDGANGLIGFGNGSTNSYPDLLFPQTVYGQTWVGSISYDSETHHWDTLECPIGHEVNGIFLLSQQGKTWRDLLDTGWSNKLRWELVAYKQFIPIGWKIIG